MTLRNLLAAACLLLPLMASAHNIEKGQRVPPVGIADRGELILDNDKFSYKAWNSAQLAGKVRVVQHIAGRTSAKEKNATLVVVWVETSPEIVHKRMIDRNSDRDTWKLEHWDEYIAGCNFEIPENLKRPGAKDSLIIFKNNNEKEFENSMKKCVSILDETMNEDSLQQVG